MWWVSSRGSKVDNIGCGGGGIIVGVSLDDKTMGQLNAVGYDSKCMQHTHTDNGIELKGHTISHFKKCVEFALNLHERFPVCGMCGWDIALDEQERPILIEPNINQPGIQSEQLCAGPIFGNRTDEVFAYLKQHHNRIFKVRY